MANNDKVGRVLELLLRHPAAGPIYDVDIFVSRKAATEVSKSDTPSRESVVEFLKGLARVSQGRLVSRLEDSGAEVATQCWINNSVAARLGELQIREVLEREDVELVEAARYAPIERLLDTQADESSASLRRGGISWGVSRVKAPELWEKNFDGSDVLVAVIDTGVNYEHPDLRARMWNGGMAYPLHGYDFENDRPDPADRHGHGTACAGIVAGDGAGGRRTGVAPGATVMALRVGDDQRQCWRAFEFAIDHGADVISLSMTWKYPDFPCYTGWRRACESILAVGVLHANSIGNEGKDLYGYPKPFNIATPGNVPSPWTHPGQPIGGGLASVMACGATKFNDRLADFSGRGPAAWETNPYTDYPYKDGGLLKPDICAPGVRVPTCNRRTLGNLYRTLTGTSAATPIVAGCFCLLAQAARKYGQPIVPARMQEALEAGAVPLSGQTTKENHIGAGLVDVEAAFDFGKARGWWA